MKQLLLLPVVIAILSMTMSCSKTQSSSSTATEVPDSTTETTTDTTAEILDSIDVYVLRHNLTVPETGKHNIGDIPAGIIFSYRYSLYNFESVREAKVDRIEFDTLFIKKAETSLDYLKPNMYISLEFEVKAQTKPGPFDTDIDIYFKNVKRPLTVPIHGNIQ